MSKAGPDPSQARSICSEADKLKQLAWHQILKPIQNNNLITILDLGKIRIILIGDHYDIDQSPNSQLTLTSQLS